MPTYEYECQRCGHKFEEFQEITAAPRSRCPLCRGKVRRLIGGGIGIVFKGSGWYATDSRRPAAGAARGAGGDAAGAPPEGGKDAAPAPDSGAREGGPGQPAPTSDAAAAASARGEGDKARPARSADRSPPEPGRRGPRRRSSDS